MIPSTSPAAALSTRIQQHFDQLPQAEKRLADVMLESPGRMASYSASEITRMANVSNATMTRLVQRLGYQNYDEMRRIAREGMDWGSPLYLLNRQEQTAPTDGERLYEQHIAHSTQNIRATFAAIPPTLINEVGKKIVKARQIRIFGQRNNYFFASYLRWQFIQFRSNVQVLPVSGETVAEYLAGLEPDDVFIVFGLRRRHPLLAELIATVTRSGVKTLLITDASNQSDLGAEWVLRCHTKSPIPLDNHTAVMALCHVLSAQVIEKMGSAGRQRLAKIEELHSSLKEL